MEQKKRQAGRAFSNVILIVAILVFLFSGYKLYEIFSEYQKGVKEYNALEEVAFGTETPEFTEAEEFQLREVDFEALQEINSEIVGWLQFENPSKINYPLVQTTDNSKYLHTTFEGKRNASGALFVDKDNAGDFCDANTFIYGHNMKNGSMFSKLREYKKKSFCEKNPYFYIHTPDGEVNKYEIFAVSIVKDLSESYQKWYNTQEEYQAYIEHARQVSLYRTDVEVPEFSRIVSLSTCTNVAEDERLLVQGVLVSEGE